MLLTAAVFFVFISFLTLIPSIFNPVSAQAVLTITKTASPEPVYTGNTLNYTITVTNIGTGPAQQVTVYDTVTAFINPVYRITTSGDWNPWPGFYDFGTVSHSNPNVRNVYLRGQISLTQCENVSNIAYVSHLASSDTIAATVLTTVIDNQTPVINCPPNITQSAITGGCHALVTISPATATDNCGVASVAGVRSDALAFSDPFPVGATTITWTATDLSGNFSTCLQTIVILDEEYPTINCPGNIVAGTNLGSCNATVTTPNPVFSDNCAIVKLEWLLTGATTGVSPTTGINYLGTHTFNPGLTMVTYRVEDASGNKSTCAFHVTVEDITNPIINCTGDKTVNVGFGICTYTHANNSWNATGFDNCIVASIVYELSGANSGSGTTLNGIIFNLGITTATWTITDGNGNTSQCSFTITVLDNQNPMINCTGNHTVTADAGACTYTHSGTSWDATGSDNCIVASVVYTLSGATSGTGISLDGVAFNVGVTTVIWVVTDGSGNAVQCIRAVTVTDNENPVINCQGNQVASANPGICTYSHSGTGWDATGSDNCTASITYTLSGATTGSGTTLNGVTFNLGTTTATWTITDGSGNTAQCSHTINITDTENPIINCAGNQSVFTDPGVCTYTHSGAAWNATGSDNCSVSSIIYVLSGATTGTGTTLNGVAFNLGITTATWTITDGSGNSTQCSHTITVTDNEIPIINCAGNQAVGTDPGACTYTHSGTGWNATGTDNCTIASITYALSGATTGTGTTLGGVTFNLGTTTATWTITDGNGNTAECSHTITVTDNEDPIINCTANQSVNSDPGVCSYTHNGTTWDATGTDNCTIASITYALSGATSGTGTTLNGVTFNPGVTTATWTITDGNGNTAECSHTITINDNENPTINCAVDQSVITNAGVCTYTHSGTGWDATGSDNCIVASITFILSGATTGTGTTLNGVAFNLGITTATWTITDGSGNTAQCSHTIAVTDAEIPTINCTGNQSVNTNAGVCTYTHNGTGWDATGTDNCTVASITFTLSGATTGTGTTLNGVSFNLGVTTATWTITDGSGNTAQCSYTITVTDIENPVVNCISNQTVNTGPGLCTYTHSGPGWDATGSDNCSTASITYSLGGATSGTGTTLNGITFNLGVTTVTWTITDGSGNTAQCSFTVTVQDVENPMVNCIGNQSISADNGVCTYTHIGVAWDAVGSDNCSVASLTYELSGATTGSGASLSGVTFNSGTTTVTWTITDSSGNTATCSFTVTVEDLENPVISCPGNQTVNTGPGTCTYLHSGTSWNATGSDNCSVASIVFVLSGATTGNGSSLNGVSFNLGTTIVTWTITDGSGNTAECFYTVTVQDNENPGINCPGNQVVNTNAGVCTYTHSGNSWNAVGSDNCTVASLEYELSGATSGSGSSLNGVTFSMGVTTVLWTITDGSGNTAQCNYTVTVEDNENPTINCPANQTVNTAAGTCSYTHNGSDWDATGADNCSVSSLIYILSGATTGTGTTLNGITFNLGTTTVSWTITDGTGNTTTCSTTITVQDIENPVINCIGNQTVNNNTGLCEYTHTGTGWNATASDNCSITSITYTLSGASTGTGTSLNGIVFNSGITTVNWVAIDGSGNSDTCDFTVMVIDVEPPTITCPLNQTRNTNPNVCTYTVIGNEFNPLAFADNCPGATISNNFNGTSTLAGVVLPLGATTIVWTVTDAASNTASCSFTVTIEDNQPPVINCPPSFSRNVNSGVCHASVQAFYLAATYNDNCGVTPANVSWILTGVTTGNGTGLMPNTNFNVGITTVTYTITDNSGNTGQCSFNVTVVDNILPTIFITNKVRNNDPGQCYYTVIGNEFQPTFNDNCPGATIQNNYNNSNTLAGATFPVGTTTVIWTVTDASGNMATRTFNVIVTDNEPPVIICPPNITVPCPDNVPVPDSTLVTAFDNCGTVSVWHHHDEYYGLGWSPGFCPDSIGRTYRAVDAAGNVSYCTHMIRVAASCGCEICQTDVPHFWVNLTGNCDSTWTSPNVRREGLCCDATWPERCISFSVMIDQNALGFHILMDGASPPGWYYQVNCDTMQPLGEAICVPPGIYHTVTICKPGSNRNVYTIKSLCGIITVGDITARVDCDNVIEVAGVPPSSVQWHNITGDYLHYLNPPSGSLTTIFNPDTLSPVFLQYLVCGGVPENPCGNSLIVCDTVSIWVVPRIQLAIDPPNPQFCEDDPKIIYADVWPIGFYEFHWLDSLNNVIEMGMQFVPPGPGRYAIAAYDTVSPLPCPYDTLFFEVTFQNCIPHCPQQYHCVEDDIVIYLTVDEFIAAGGVVDFPCGIPNTSINVVGEPWTNGLSCPETIIYTYIIVDSCGNSDICDVIVLLGDTIPPTFSLPGDTIYCVEDIIQALYNPDGIYPVDDLTYPRPDYYLHTVGNTILDLLDLDDNCTAPENLVITWEFDFGSNGNIDMAGSGQLSGPPPIYFPVGTNIIYFTVTDECGNSTTTPLTLIVRPRPDIQDDF